LAAGFLAAAFLAGAFFAGAFLAAGFLAVGINLPPFFPQMRESCCEKIVNNSLARVNKFGPEMRQQLFSVLTKFLKNIFAEAEARYPAARCFLTSSTMPETSQRRPVPS
jgi:hypothetical protein